MPLISFALEPPAPPSDPASGLPTLQAIYERLDTGTNVPVRAGAFAGPPAAPEASMVTLDMILSIAPGPALQPAQPEDVLAGKTFWALGGSGWGLSTGTAPVNIVSSGSSTLAEGFYPAATYPAIETDLQPSNIQAGTVVMGVTGTTYFAQGYPAPIAQTGSTNTYLAGDDGSIRRGIAWPSPRFVLVDGYTNRVMDALTGLIWLRAPSYFGSFNNAIAYCNALDGGSGWRMPNIRELLSLIDFNQISPALPAQHLFYLTPDQINGQFWTSTRRVPSSGSLGHRTVNLGLGNALAGTQNDNANSYWAWPVRDGIP